MLQTADGSQAALDLPAGFGIGRGHARVGVGQQSGLGPARKAAVIVPVVQALVIGQRQVHIAAVVAQLALNVDVRPEGVGQAARGALRLIRLVERAEQQI